MTFLADVQKLEPGAKILLFEVDATPIGGDVARFHAHTKNGSIIWQGNEYKPWPVNASGFGMSGEGQQPTPTVTLGNVGGAISSLCIALDDLVGAKVIVHTTFRHYLDAINFPAGNPGANPNEEAVQLWYVSRKSREDNVSVQFDLLSPANFNGQVLPARPIIRLCTWQYRDADCGYTGGPVADGNDEATTDPSVDTCGKRVKSCKLRFGATNPLPHGGFPSAALIGI